MADLQSYDSRVSAAAPATRHCAGAAAQTWTMQPTKPCCQRQCHERQLFQLPKPTLVAHVKTTGQNRNNSWQRHANTRPPTCDTPATAGGVHRTDTVPPGATRGNKPKCWPPWLQRPVAVPSQPCGLMGDKGSACEPHAQQVQVCYGWGGCVGARTPAATHPDGHAGDARGQSVQKEA